MSSSVFFKFKSQKEPTKITFDGTGISVFELKREIINVTGLGDGTDFDLSIYSDDNNEEYDDDTTIIPRSTTVIARRIPASRPGHGRAARYVSGQAPVTAKNAYRTETSHKGATSQDKSSTANQGFAAMNEAQTEEEKLAAMFQADANQWELQQQQMAHAKPVFNRNYKGKPVNVPDHDPPPGYICYRCHEKGHWIQACPTNDDPNFEAKPKIKRTTGIPNSFLKTVAKPVAVADDGLTDNRQPTGVMINAKGEYVVAEPDKASWEKFQAKAEASKEQQAAANLGNKDLQNRGLECPIDKRLFVDPVKTPCCGKTYCNECIENALVDNDLTCPNCNTPNILIDNLTADDEAKAKIKAYEDEMAAENEAREVQKKVKESTPVADVDNEAPKTDGKDEEKPATNPSTPAASDSISPKTKVVQPAGSTSPKKRPAEEELSNDRIPTGPKAMREANASKAPNAPNNAGGSDQDFFNAMNALAAGSMPPNGQNMPAFNFPNMNGMPFPNPMMMMNNGMMPNGFNPMMNPMMNNGFNPMGGGFGPNMNMNMGMGFPQQGNMFNQNNNGFGGQQQNWQGNGQWNQGGNGQGRGGGFANQQKTVFSEPFPNEEDNAYMRRPVNPHRHQNRQRRVRPSDYTEL